MTQAWRHDHVIGGNSRDGLRGRTANVAMLSACWL
jgi:hypothetical protein